jgi:hypothetical protein
MTAPVKAASNGAETTEPAPQRKTGMAHVHEAEAYHTATLAHDAAFEAERLCSDIYRAVSGAYLRDGGTVSEAAETAADPATERKAREAIECLHTAQRNLRALIDDPPF